MLRLERKEGVRRQHVGVEGETIFLTRQCFSLIRFVTTRAALAWCAWLTYASACVVLTADLCTALFHNTVEHGGFRTVLWDAPKALRTADEVAFLAYLQKS